MIFLTIGARTTDRQKQARNDIKIIVRVKTNENFDRVYAY